MKYFLGIVIILLLYTACSTTETVQEEPTETEAVSAQPSEPAWYTPGVYSSSDSLSAYGYSLASAADSARAVELSTRSSIESLRLEIDKITEEIREELAESNSGSAPYNSPAFIIQLRNTVSGLSLNSAIFTREHHTSDSGIHYSYTRTEISRPELYNLFENQLQDERFLEMLGQ